MCTFALLGRVRVVTVTAKQSALQSPLQSHSSVLSAPPPTPRKPLNTIICDPPDLPGEMPCPDTFHSSFPSPFPHSGKQKVSRCIFATATKSHLAISADFIRLLFVCRMPRSPSTSSSDHLTILLPPKPGPLPQPPSDTGAGPVTLLSFKASFSLYINPLTNPSHAWQRHHNQPLPNTS